MMNCPKNERPREKAKLYGIESLSNQELIALMLRTGNKEMSVLYLAQYLLDEIGGFKHLKDIVYGDLVKIKGIKEAKAIEILACVELAKRMQNDNETKSVIQEPVDCYRIVKNKLQFEKQEKLMLLCLNNQLEVVLEKVLFVGGMDSSTIDSREILAQTLKIGCHRIVVVHNHPSGNPAPSSEDIDFTSKLLAMCEQLDIELIDHIIVGRGRFYSFSSAKVYEMKDN